MNDPAPPSKPVVGRGIVASLLVVEVLCLATLIYAIFRYRELTREMLVDPAVLQSLVVACFVAYILVLVLRERRTADRVVGEKIRTAQVIDSLPMGLLIVDGGGLIVSINERACAALVADPVMSLNRPLAGWIDEQTARKLAGNFAGRAEATASKGGAKLHLNVLPLHDGSGKVIALEETERTQKFLRHAPPGVAAFPKARPMFDRLWNELSSMVPAEGGAPEPLARGLVMARRLRSFAESLAGPAGAVHRTPGDLGELTRGCAARLEPLRRARRVHLEITTTGEVTGVFDHDRLGEAVEEILLNALAYSRPGGRVSAHVSGDARDLSLVVRDEGIGTTEEEVRRVWEPEFQGSQQHPETAGARGLGLARVRQIVESHGGSPLFESLKGAGTRVTVAIPKTS